MGIYALTELLESAPVYRQLADSLRRNKALSSTQVIDEAVPFLLATLWSDLRTPLLIICPSGEYSRRLEERISAWTEGEGHPLRFGESETLPFERLVTDWETSQQRLSTLAAITNPNNTSPLVIASATAICQGTIQREIFDRSKHTLLLGDEVSSEELLMQWQQMGYSIEPTVTSPGEVARRGGILDIYPLGSENPYRIELWGDEIDSIRKFDPATQKSLVQVKSVEVFPARETLPMMLNNEAIDRILGRVDLSDCSPSETERFNSEMDLLLEGHEIEDLNLYSGFFNQGSLLDYFPDGGIVAVYRPADVSSAAWDTEERIQELRRAKEERGELPYNFPSNHVKWSKIESALANKRRQLKVMPWGAEDLIVQDMHIMPFSSPPTYVGDIDALANDVRMFLGTEGRVIASTSHSLRLGELFEEHNLSPALPEDIKKIPEKGTITVIQPGGENIGDGFVLNISGQRLMMLGDTEIFGMTKQRRSARQQSARREAFFEEISPGDYVVHVEHGIARFVGTGRRGSEDKRTAEGQEYLILEYSKGDRLFVPLDHLDRVAPYVAPMERSPSLTRLGTQEWNRTKAKVERSTKEMAFELLSLYAERELAEGHPMGPDTRWQIELENSFPYEETPDQLSTLSEVKSDLESARPMDRLVCGDVGYGKTEIALRAAFKAVMDGKQVAVLVPTTILAQQHFETFSSRLNAFPVKVEMLSRFRSFREQKNIVDKVNNGAVDICIGTHRLVQKDVKFKDLGLIIIDEEQRFGVAHKERLKRMRSQADVLTLTATPIPRTLHMSLAGVRDMSTIETAPEERLPIKTYVSEFSDDLIREAVLRELDRGGQVYFLHNRVYNIEYMAEYVERLVPDARVGIAHGQMSEDQLQKSMMEFTRGRIDVLVCTTIIESGLDIPNANTLIVNRADNFGLAQLYQLRGRIGRSSRRGYSYLLIPRARSLTEAADRRLRAMLAATELGSGFRIAMKDLEIRGAGNILGAEQSGNIHAVGFDLYTRLLSTAVEDLRAQKLAEESGSEPPIKREGHSVAVDLRIPAAIPEEYVSDLPTRLDVYQKLIKTRSVEEVTVLEGELRDRFGPLPWQATNLLYVKQLRLKAQDSGAESIMRNGDKITLQFPHEVSGASAALTKLLGPRWIIGNKQIRTTVKGLGDSWEDQLVETIEKLADFQKEMTKRFDKVTAI